MTNIETTQSISDTLLESIKIAAQVLLNTATSNAVDNVVNKLESYIDLLAISVQRFQTVNNLIKTAQSENRDLTPDELEIAIGFYNTSLAEVQEDLKS